ncbi:MAG: hypothetical protein QMB24_03775, partial [Spirosomataceae bacterium]
MVVLTQKLSTTKAIHFLRHNYLLIHPFGFRVEFSELNGYFAGIKGSQSNSTVLFVNAGADTDASLGILEPSEYCNFNGPNILTTCYVNG